MCGWLHTYSLAEQVLLNLSLSLAVRWFFPDSCAVYASPLQPDQRVRNHNTWATASVRGPRSCAGLSGMHRELDGSAVSHGLLASSLLTTSSTVEKTMTTLFFRLYDTRLSYIGTSKLLEMVQPIILLGPGPNTVFRCEELFSRARCHALRRRSLSGQNTQRNGVKTSA